jgi:hypothetical protein
MKTHPMKTLNPKQPKASQVLHLWNVEIEYKIATREGHCVTSGSKVVRVITKRCSCAELKVVEPSLKQIVDPEKTRTISDILIRRIEYCGKAFHRLEIL